MKVICRFCAKQHSAPWLLCLLVILNRAGTCQARFLDPAVAKMHPRARLASYASSTIGTRFIGPEDLGVHRYRANLLENNGIVYTCRAGHIDIAHLRKATDWTAYFAAKVFEHLQGHKTEFSFKLYEPSRYFVRLDYPEDWDELSPENREQIIYDISILLGQYFAYTATTWHEIITWFGYKCTGFYPEFPSAFSWEDTFSNLLGSHIGALALRDDEHPFDEAVTLALARELEKLGAVPAQMSKWAAEKVRGTWYTVNLIFVDVKKRNFDIGLDDGFVTPLLIPLVPECESAEPVAYPVPTLDLLYEHGFSMKLEIEPRVWEKGKILRIVYPDKKERKNRIEPAIHFITIMNYIKEDAVKRYGDDVGLYYADSAEFSVHPAQTQNSSGYGDGQNDINNDMCVDFDELKKLAVNWLMDIK